MTPEQATAFMELFPYLVGGVYYLAGVIIGVAIILILERGFHDV